MDCVSGRAGAQGCGFPGRLRGWVMMDTMKPPHALEMTIDQLAAGSG